MRMRKSSLPALLLIAFASNLPAAIDYTITSENDGLNSRLSWVASGVETTTGYAWPVQAPSPFGIGGIDVGTGTADVKPIFTASLSTLPIAFSREANNSYAITTGLSVTNMTTGDSITFDGIWFIKSGNYEAIVLDSRDQTMDANINTGDIVKYTGTTTGHVILPIAYSFFNPGFYSSFSPPSTGPNTLTIGTPVPEPSTYGLILGGLALAGTAVRRRMKKQAA